MVLREAAATQARNEAAAVAANHATRLIIAVAAPAGVDVEHRGAFHVTRYGSAASGRQRIVAFRCGIGITWRPACLRSGQVEKVEQERETRNPKLEIRNKLEIRSTETRVVSSCVKMWASRLEFHASDLFRISSFGFV